MSLFIVLGIALASGIGGVALGWFLRFLISLSKKGSMELEIKEMLLGAREESEKIINEAEKKSELILDETRKEIETNKEEIKESQDRLIKKESYLDQRQQDIDQKTDDIQKKLFELEQKEIDLNNLLELQKTELEKITRLDEKNAKEELFKILENKYNNIISKRIYKLENVSQKEIEKKAKDILASTIHRLGNQIPADIFTYTIDLTNDEIKGKIIGKEGRNIKTFERITGVDLIIDDTPSIITVSSYDPIRRAIAKTALENLVTDGRINPAKIEQEVEKAEKEIQNIIKEKGEQAAFECGIFDLDKRILHTLGKLHFRTSYGQNVLNHSIEMAHIAGMLAEELGANVKVAKTAALVHDIGKALDHEVSGSHVEIGRRILQKFGANEEVIKAMQAHHEEYPFETIESIIIKVADSISGSRPGARRDTVEKYIKRLEDLESIASQFNGVEKAYVIEAGREIRVFVKPEEIDDIKAQKLAEDISKQIENELKYPGEIKIVIIRESRAISFAR